MEILILNCKFVNRYVYINIMVCIWGRVGAEVPTKKKKKKWTPIAIKLKIVQNDIQDNCLLVYVQIN